MKRTGSFRWSFRSNSAWMSTRGYNFWSISELVTWRICMPFDFWSSWIFQIVRTGSKAFFRKVNDHVNLFAKTLSIQFEQFEGGSKVIFWTVLKSRDHDFEEKNQLYQKWNGMHMRHVTTSTKIRNWIKSSDQRPFFDAPVLWLRNYESISPSILKKWCVAIIV